MPEFDPALNAEQQTKIVEKAWKGSSAGFRIQIALLHLAKARELNERASMEMLYWKLALKIAEWENRTGLDHDKLLRFAHVDYRWMFADPSTSARLPIDIDGDGYVQLKTTEAAVNTALGNDYDLTAQVSAISTETLLVYARDSILGTVVAEAYKSLLPNSELVWVEGGHLPSAEDPKEFQPLVTSFLTDHA